MYVHLNQNNFPPDTALTQQQGFSSRKPGSWSMIQHSTSGVSGRFAEHQSILSASLLITEGLNKLKIEA